MAIRSVTIGSLVNFHAFDDAVHAYGLDTDAPARVGTAPGAGDEVVRLDDLTGTSDDKETSSYFFASSF